MKYAPRLYSCVLCHAQAVICNYCDRGQIYCTKNCSYALFKKIPSGNRLNKISKLAFLKN